MEETKTLQEPVKELPPDLETKQGWKTPAGILGTCPQ